MESNEWLRAALKARSPLHKLFKPSTCALEVLLTKRFFRFTIKSRLVTADDNRFLVWSILQASNLHPRAWSFFLRRHLLRFTSFSDFNVSFFNRHSQIPPFIHLEMSWIWSDSNALCFSITFSLKSKSYDRLVAISMIVAAKSELRYPSTSKNSMLTKRVHWLYSFFKNTTCMLLIHDRSCLTA